MAIAVYDSDLTSTNGGELTTASAVANWDESSDGGYDDGGGAVDEVNFYIQGAECISGQFTKTGVGTLINIQGTAFTVDIDGAILIWSFWASPSSLTTYALGGIRTLVGNSLGDFYTYKASGSDFEPNPIGGWYNFALDPASATIDTTVGTPTGTWTHVGTAINATAQSRGNPHAVDAIRVGRCSLEVTLGDATAYGTFTGMGTFDTSTDQRYALFQKIFGGYRWQGLMSIGVTGTAVDFRDSNANIFVANTPQVSPNFSKIEIHNVASNVEWTSISISAQDGVENTIAATASKGNFEVVDSATVSITTCTFTDMGNFTFNAATNSNTITSTIFRRCGLITTGGATYTGCTFDKLTGVTGVLTSSPANATLISNSEFISAGTGNGLEITGTAADITLTNVDFTGYSTTVDADKAIFVNIASGTVNINISGGSGVATASDVRTAGATINIIAGAVTIKTIAQTDTGTLIQNARIKIKASDGTGIFPYNETVTITSAAGIATVAHTAHNMATNDYVEIDGANEFGYNKVTQITVTGVNSYTYPTTGTPTTPATGTIRATFVALYGLTDINGEISTSRVYATAQPITGWARKSSNSPYYKEGSINGIISTTLGFTGTAVMVSDE